MRLSWCGPVALSVALACAPCVYAQVLVTPPRVLHATPAVDPLDAPAHTQPIDVRLELTVDATGNVTEVSVTGSAGPPWDAAAVAAVRAMTFAPATRDGTPVPARLRYRYHFSPTPVAVPTVAPPVSSPVPTPVTPPTTPSPAAEAPAGEATVRAARPPREVTRYTVDEEEISHIPGTNGDALRAVQNLPGVARAPFMTGVLIVRGSAPQDSAVFVDGTLVPLIYHFGGLTSVVPTELLDHIDFYPGNFAAEYGRAQGGVVDVALRSPRTDGFHASAEASLIDAGLRIEGPLGHNLSFLVAARRSYVDAVIGPFLQDAGLNAISLPVYYDYQAMLEWRPTSHDAIRLLAMGSDDRFSFAFARPQDADPSLNGQLGTATVFHRVQLRWTHDFAPGTSLRVLAATGIDDVSVAFGRVANLATDRIPIDVRADFSQRVSRILRWSAGLDLLSGPFSLSFTGPRAPGEGSGDIASTSELAQIATQVNAFAFRPAAWVDMELTPTPALRLVPSLRVDYYGDIATAVVSPRLALRVTVAPGWVLKAGVGLFSQPPQLQESINAPNYAVPGTLVGNPNLAPQRTIHYDIGFEHDFSQYISLSVEGFYKTLDQLVVQPGDPAAVVPYTNVGIGRIYGMELLLRHRLSHRFFGWIAYTLSRSEIRDAPGQAFNPAGFDQTHIFTAVASVRLGRGWEIGARWRYVTGFPDATVLGTLFDANALVYIPVYPPVYDIRVPPFHQLDIRVDKVWHFRTWQLGIFLDLLNAYNRANPEFYSYSYDYSQRGIVQGLPIIPSLGIRGEY